jgi:hypothetical protein
LAQQVDEHRAANPGRPVEVWAFDEHRVGLKPITRRQWAPKGQRPTALGQHRFEWLYVYGFVHPSTGEVVWFLCNGVSTLLLGAVLAAFAAAVGAGREKLVVLVLDNAGWHSSDKLVVPEGLMLAFLPPYSPELQPAERLWPLTNEAVANQSFASLKELDEALGARCCALTGMPEVIKSYTSYGRWPKPPQALASET